MDINNLNDSEKAALAKAEASSVRLTIEGADIPLTGAKPAGTVEVIPPAGSTPAPAPAPAPAAAPEPAAAAPAKPQRPEWVPEKFWDGEKGEVRTEAMAKSYRELETKNSQPKPGEVPKPPTMEAAAAAPAKAEADAAAAADPAKLRQEASDAAGRDITQTGKISEESYAKLEKAGYARADVDAYVEGLQAKAQVYLGQVHETAGGKAEFEKLLSWGKVAYTPAEVQAFDAAINSSDAGQMQQAVNGLKARYAAEFGKSGKTIVPANADNKPANVGFKNAQEMRDAMKDPRYTKGDAAFHAEVRSKIAAAEKAGVNLDIRIHGR